MHTHVLVVPRVCHANPRAHIVTPGSLLQFLAPPDPAVVTQ
jgi:hypothetical protein